MADRNPLVVTMCALAFGVSRRGTPDWFGVLRTVMMVVGGIVVVAIILVVSVAIISGVLGMIGRLRKRHD